ncbi:HNH endonuclease signature motif containing protein [Pseudomonas asplenii]|uniref:HNH endonuclease signature motif containing protein n=1 Tax=Pseudomonas asplenii TaxID=53407 RepID=UPI000364BB95
MAERITAQEARRLFEVVDGKLVNRIDRQFAKAGSICGGVNGWGYVHFQYQGHTYKAHRVIWLCVYGNWPGELDHINGNRSDNRIENLREVSRQENLRNQKVRTNSSTGAMGVTREGRKWRARIRVDGAFIHLGYFDSIDEAVAARRAANIKYGFHENHGRPAA